MFPCTWICSYRIGKKFLLLCNTISSSKYFFLIIPAPQGAKKGNWDGIWLTLETVPSEIPGTLFSVCSSHHSTCSWSSGRFALRWVRSHFGRVQFFVTLWSVTFQAPLSLRILQARILGWVAMPSSWGSSWPRDWNCISYISFIGRWVFSHLCHPGSPCLVVIPLHQQVCWGYSYSSNLEHWIK